MQTYDLVFDAVTNPSIRVTITSTFFFILSDGGGSVDISMRRNGGFETIKGVSAGFGLKLKNGDVGQEFIIDSEISQTIKIFMGDDEAIYNRISGAVSVNSMPKTALFMTNFGRTVSNSSIQILMSEKPDRRYFMVQNNDANAVMRLSISQWGNTANWGFRVPPGGVFEMSNYVPNGQITAIMESATSQALNVTVIEG